MEEINKKGFVKYHLPCPLCSSSDAVSVNADNSAYCFSCQEFIKEYDMEAQPTIPQTKNEYEVKDFMKESNYAEIIERNISISLIGAVTSPLSLFVIGFATLSLPEGMQKAAPLVPALKSNWLMMHVSIMMLSYSTLITGSLLSILFLVLTLGKNVSLQGSSLGGTNLQQVDTRNMSMAVLEGTIPNKTKLGSSDSLSLLETLDNLSYRIIGLGFPLLTTGIIAGAVWANEAWGAYWSWDPKETWALITWFVFAAYLHARITKSWQGKRPAILASIGFVVVWICYLGVNFLGKGLHSYGWIA